MMETPPNMLPGPRAQAEVLPWRELELALRELACRPEQEAVVAAAVAGFRQQVAYRPLIDTMRELVIFCWLTLEQPAQRPDLTRRQEASAAEAAIP